jgi:hypothetical protein
MSFLVPVLIALLAWTSLSWVCGIVLGGMIDRMEGEEESEDPGGARRPDGNAPGVKLRLVGG